RAESLLAELRLRHDSFVEAREMLEQARGEAEEDSPLQVSIGLQLTFVLYSLGLLREAADCADAALALAEKLAIPGLLAQALGAAATTDFAIGRGVDEGRLRRGLFLEDPETWSSAALHPAVTASMVLGFTGRLGEAVDLLERLRKEYDQRGEEHDLAWLGTRLSWFECWRGNLDAAEQHVMEASDRLLALGTTVGRMLALTAQAQLDAYAGRADSARKGAEAALALADETDWKGAMTWQHMTLGFLELSLGDPDAAAVRLAPLAAEAIESGLPEPAADGALVHGDAAEALILVGRVAEAALERALEAHESLPMPIERGRTLLALGRVQRRLRERRAAKKTLEQSLAVFEGVGSKLWADQARGELAAIGLRAGPPDELTASEERVARLAATG